jgi:proliferating cell nuclear antigen PCNA
MKLIINDKQKKDTLIALFQMLKISTSFCNMMFKDNFVHIQGMDKTHICLFDVNINNGWFDTYERTNNDSENICFDSEIFHSIINTKHDGNKIIIFFDGNADNLNIDLISESNSKNKNKNDFDKHFKIPLAEFEYDVLELPDTEYDAEFSINSKKICDITSQMLQFGNDLHIDCTEEKIDFISSGINGEMLVNIPIDELDEFSIVEGDNINLDYSLVYINKNCLTNKLSNTINISISKEFPMKIKYDLGNDSSVTFYIASKMQ